MSQRRLGLLAVAAAAIAVGMASPARGDTFVTMSGELAHGTVADPATAAVDCEDGSGTIRYSVVGTAEGPYPGTFEETGTITVRDNLVVGFTARFEIDSPVALVTGTKTFLRLANVFCGPDPEEIVPGEFGQGTLIARYEATISSASGTFRDKGLSGVGFGITEFSPGVGGGGVSQGFDSHRENATLFVEPVESINAVGTTHTVTALLRDPLPEPIAGERIIFIVEGSVMTTGTCTTNAEGMCDFTYMGPAIPGVDAITACYDFDDSGSVDPGERCTTVSKVWIQPVPGAGGASGGGYIGTTEGEQVLFGFAAEPTGSGLYRGSCSVVDHATDTHVRCLDVTQLIVAGTHATFFGEAEVNGVATNYRIDVHDLTNEDEGDTFFIETDTGYTAGGVVTNGNVRVNSG